MSDHAATLLAAPAPATMFSPSHRPTSAARRSQTARRGSVFTGGVEFDVNTGGDPESKTDCRDAAVPARMPGTVASPPRAGDAPAGCGGGVGGVGDYHTTPRRGTVRRRAGPGGTVTSTTTYGPPGSRATGGAGTTFLAGVGHGGGRMSLLRQGTVEIVFQQEERPSMSLDALPEAGEYKVRRSFISFLRTASRKVRRGKSDSAWAVRKAAAVGGEDTEHTRPRRSSHHSSPISSANGRRPPKPKLRDRMRRRLVVVASALRRLNAAKADPVTSLGPPAGAGTPGGTPAVIVERLSLAVKPVDLRRGSVASTLTIGSGPPSGSPRHRVKKNAFFSAKSPKRSAPAARNSSSDRSIAYGSASSVTAPSVSLPPTALVPGQYPGSTLSLS